MKKRILSMLLAFAVLLSTMPGVALAESGGELIPEDAAFTALSTDAGEVIAIEERDVVNYNGYDVPHYHVTIPEGANEVYVTHPSSENPFADLSYGSAYGYYAETEGWTGGYMTFQFMDAHDGATIIFPLGFTSMDWMTGETIEGSFVADEDGYVGYAVAVERSDDFSPICFFTFEYGAADEGGDEPNEPEQPEEPAKPFLSIKIGNVEIEVGNIVYKGIFEMGDYHKDEQQGTQDGYDYVHEVPYYHITIPCGTLYVDVTYSAETNILNDGKNAYGYATELELDAVSSATVKSRTLKDAYTKNDDGTQTVKTPVTGYTFDESGKGMAITLEEDGGTYAAICLFSFVYDMNHVYDEETGLCTCGAKDTSKHYHSYEGVVTTPPTCTTEGVKTFTCSGCEEGTEGRSYTESVPKLGHKYNDGEVTTEPTCAAEGVKTFTCTREGCTEETKGHRYTETIAKAAHTYDEGEVAKEATCAETGVMTYTCTVCGDGTEGHTKTETIAKLTTHSYDGENGVDTTQKTCSVCGTANPGYVNPNMPELVDGFYQIGTAEQLVAFAEFVNAGNTSVSAVLTADIDLTGVEWPGIGTSSKKFAGSFDGQNHTVTFHGSEFGLFAYTMGTYNSSNFSAKQRAYIANVITAGNTQNTPLIHVAGYTHVTNCVNKADVTGSNSYVAGIVGSLTYALQYNSIRYNDVLIENCVNEGNISGESYVAGIFGEGMSGVKVQNCCNIGVISGSDNVGGLVGYLQQYKGTCKIENSYNHGKVSGSSNAGGIVGNLYNSASVVNCYNAGEATYGIAGNIYNNTASITNCYYLSSKSAMGIPEKTQTAGVADTTRYVAVPKTLAELCSEEFVILLGESFQLSCPGPVFTWQTAKEHQFNENNECTVCGLGVKQTFTVTLVDGTGYSFTGEATVLEGDTYSFGIIIAEGYEKSETFTVKVGGMAVEPVNGDSYEIENVTGNLIITAEGVNKIPDTYPVTLPEGRNGYRVTGERTAVRGGDYTFTVTFVDHFRAGENFKVMANGVELSGVDGVYTISNVMAAQTITISGVEMIPYEETVTIRLTATRGLEKFIVAPGTETVMMDLELTVPYFDIALYNLARYYYNPYCYLDENGNPVKIQTAGNIETAYGNITLMHAFIYATEVYCLEIDPEDAGQGLSMTMDSDKDGKSDFEELISWTGGVGSSFMNLWGYGTNLNYYKNYTYPLGKPGWGSTSDQELLKDGDVMSIHFITGNASGSNFGVFVAEDEDGIFTKETDTLDRATVMAGETIELTLFWSKNDADYTTSYETMAGKELYWILAEDGMEIGQETIEGEGDPRTVRYASIKDWNREDFGATSLAELVTDENGKVVIDTTGLEPGIYYIAVLGGETAGGQTDNGGFVSRGGETGVTFFELIVTENISGEEPESPAYSLGDVDMDGDVDSNDAALIIEYYYGKRELTEAQRKLADVNSDGEVNTNDAGKVLDYYYGKIDTLA